MNRLKTLINKNYLIYGSSIVFSRGLEYLVLFFAAYYLTKEDYGELEFYKKVIEVGSSVLAFGFPALILSYTKSKDSKAHFFLLAILFVLGLGVLLGLFFSFTPWLFLVVPFVFYALFFTGGITHSYLLVQKGSDYASYYKSIVSVLFYLIIFISIYSFGVKGKAFVYVNYVLLPALLIYTFFQLKNQRFISYRIKKYWRLFKGLLLSSFTLVVSNFANLMFLYTDIFFIKLLSKNANVDIANYSFALNIAALLLLIPITLVQVDIEKLKNKQEYVSELNRKILKLTGLMVFMLLLLYTGLTQLMFLDYQETLLLFIIILFAKTVQAFSPLYGTMIVINKKFRRNLS
ncbi:oligosaccharide flippase family protein, partial [uncultured Planktosalinus sp.]|uniref:oligosaccharide flippase family protein n=1 Tax=uncultured Planktosalinus sp. TaxID=1810935 RepID=UPI0030D71839